MSAELVGVELVGTQPVGVLSVFVDVVCVRSESVAESVAKSVVKTCGEEACVDVFFNSLFSITYCL